MERFVFVSQAFNLEFFVKIQNTIVSIWNNSVQVGFFSMKNIWLLRI